MKTRIRLSRCLGLATVYAALTTGVNGGAPETSAPAKSVPGEKLNIVFFLVDDLGWSDVGYEGSRFYDTPNIDAFAERGVRFAQAYAACPVCSPTRASILTGEYPARLHLTDWLPGRKDYPFQKLLNVRSAQRLPYGRPTLPAVLKANGYQTAIFGKWHLGEDPDSTKRQGFDLHVPDWNKGWPNRTYFSPYGMKGLEGGLRGEYLTDRLTGEALKWMEKNRDRPFFLYLAHFAVHDPIQGRGDLVAKYERQAAKLPASRERPFILEGNPDDPNPLSSGQLDGLLGEKAFRGFSLLPRRTVKVKERQDNPQFAAMVEGMDESLGRVLGKLKELGLEERTIVIFFSDNGGMSAANFGNPNRTIGTRGLDRAYSTSNLPLRGGKGWLYEGGIRVPLIVYCPGTGRHGIECSVPVISTDFYATLLDLVGLSPVHRGENGMDGMSLAPLLTGEPQDTMRIEKRALFWHWPHYSNHGAQSPAGAVRSGAYKLIEYYENDTVQLFNLKADPGERHDVSRAEPEKVRELTARLHAWRKEVKAGMPTPNPNYDPQKKWPDGE